VTPDAPRRPLTSDEEILEAETPDVLSLRTDDERAARIHDEALAGFRALAGIGPAVSVFGSARTPEPCRLRTRAGRRRAARARRLRRHHRRWPGDHGGGEPRRP
jgi:hypothetical protein